MRPNIDEYFLNMARLIATRTTCSRRMVGAVLVDANDFVLSTGYNGVPKGIEHCIDKPCAGAQFAHGTKLNECQAIHAEVNAIAHCNNSQLIHTLYTTDSPCMSCMKLVIATGCRRIVAKKEYDSNAVTYFESVGGTVIFNE